MRFREFLSEASNLSTSELLNRPGRVDTFLNKIKNKQPFQLVGSTDTVTIDPSEYEKAEEFLQPGARGSLLLKTIDGSSIKTGALAKTSDFGGTAAGSKDDAIKFNRGEVAEAYHALAAFVRLIARPSRDISLQEVIKWIPKVNNGQTYKLPVKDAENKEIADEFHVTIALKPGSWEAFQRRKEILADKKFAKYVKDIIDAANTDTGPRADAYASNGKYDLIRVVGDGVSGESETKTDINFENETEKKYRGYSIKAGTVSQIHQVGGGAKNKTPEEKFDILQNELFNVHGRAQLADISSVRQEYIDALENKGPLEAQAIAYQEAVKSLNNRLANDNDEKAFVKTLAKALKFFQARDDDSILLKQFTGKGTIILDARKMDTLHEKGLDLVAEYIGSKKNPEIDIKDEATGKVLIKFRTYKSGGYVRNYIEKGPLFKEITNVKKAKE